MNAYFDNAATTQLCGAAASALTEAIKVYANPSSLHSAGLEAEKLLTASRRKVAAALGDRGGGTVIFTGCGTEANTLALFGVAYAKASNAGKNIVISDSEHPSVYENAAELQKRGFECRTVHTKNGYIDPEELSSLTDRNTLLVSIMTVNNESGALYDIKELCRAAKEKNPSVIFHTDATQAFMKTELDVSRLGADLLTVSAHKIGGPKGVGALYAVNGVIRSHSIVPILRGGGQESGLRSGTENTASVASFSAAAEYCAAPFDEDLLHGKEISDIIRAGLEDAGVRINRPANGIPHIISATLPGIKSEVMLHYLSSKGVYVSSGSACSSHHPGVSRPMQAFGLSAREADCTVRISLFRQNTAEEAALLVDSVAEGVRSLIKMRK